MSDLDIARIAAEKAGKAILKIREKGFGIETKQDTSPVTEADRTSQAIILEELSKTPYPIISEELENKNVPEKAWIVDPLDGTKNFIRGEDEFVVMIGLIENNRPILGVVYVPTTGTTFHAELGKGAFKNGKHIEVSPSSKTRVVISKNHYTDADREVTRVLKLDSITHKGSGIKLCDIAEGLADLYFNLDGLNVWDICATHLLVEEAGGSVFDTDGNPLVYKEIRFVNGIVATNGEIDEYVLKGIAKIK